VIDFKLLDSSVWIAFITKEEYSQIIESSEKLFLSILSIFEIKNKLLKDNIPYQEIINIIEFIKKRNIILPLTTDIAEKAADISAKKKMPAIDSLIYITSQLNNTQLITLDNDFRGLDNTTILD